MIVGGLVFARSMDRCIFTRTTYTLEVNFDDTSITKIEYKYVPDVPNYIYRAAFGNFRGRSLIIGGDVDNKCFHFDQEKYQVTPSLNGRRKDAASTFIQNKIVIVGGDYEDSIEILDWDESNHGNQWIESPAKFPIRVSSHTMVVSVFLVLCILETVPMPWIVSFERQLLLLFLSNHQQDRIESG